MPAIERRLDLAGIPTAVLEAGDGPALTLDHCRGSLEYLVALARDPRQITLGDIDAALASSGHNVSRAAAALGVDRTTRTRAACDRRSSNPTNLLDFQRIGR